MPEFSVTMLDNWHYKRQNKGILNNKKLCFNAKKWCVKLQFRHFKRQNLFLKLTPGVNPIKPFWHKLHQN